MTQVWWDTFQKLVKKVATTFFPLKVMLFKKPNNIWAIFVTKFVAKNFQKSSNLFICQVESQYAVRITHKNSLVSSFCYGKKWFDLSVPMSESLQMTH